jgi:TonB-linked SusC/RagA family outer membrane protein
MTKLLLFFGNYKKFPAHSVRKSGLIVLFATISVLSAVAQQVEIKGKVLEEGTKNSVIGAVIKLKGQKGGTTSDASGNFAVKVKALPVTIAVSAVGFKVQEIDVYEAEPTTIFLTEDQNRLSSVVVVGYGTQKRTELTGSIASISVPQLKESGQTTFVNALQGLAAGVQVTQTSGAPGGASSIRIRGGNSITGGNEPLYVIDGFPVYNDISSADAGAIASSTRVNPLSSISPNDIESIDVLKDASATAIYGSRGANGVIIVTTKKGQTGPARVTYDGSYGFQEISHKIDLLNAKQWGNFKNDARINNGKTALYTSAQLDSLGQHSTDWQAAALRKAPIQSHQISINGGDEKTKYSVSLGVLNQQGIIVGSDFGRYNGRVRLDSKVNDRLTVGLNINDSYSEANVVPTGIITSLLYMPPTVPVRTATGVYTFVSPYESAVANPIATLNQATNKTKTNRILANTFADYQIVKGLKAKVLLGVDLLDNKQNSYQPSTLYEANAQAGIASVGAKFTKNILNENTLTYNTTFAKDHNLELLGGFTQQQSETEGVIAGGQTFTNNNVEYNNLGSGSTLVKSSSNYVKWALESFLGRATYNFDQKYFVTASFRADGSSRLGTNNRWGYFPSTSVAWQASKEAFLRDFKEAIKLTNLKVRLSAGKTGNQEIAPYQSEALLSSYSYPSGTGTSTITGYAPSQVSNPDLKWETTAQYDGGIDIGLFQDRVKLVVDAYYKKTSDLLLAVPIPLSSGYSSSIQNIGSVENKGLEITLSTENIKSSKFNWSTDITYSINRNKVLSLNQGVNTILVASEVQTGSAIVVGQPLGAFWGYKTDGLYKNASEIPATPLLANTKVGDVKYVDVNKDGKITQAGDMTIIGNAQPKFIFGFTNNFSYANFDLSVFFQGSVGNQVYSYILQQLQVPTGYQNVIAGFNNHYTATNTTTQYQRPNELITTNPVSDLYVYDASYIRLKSLTLGYNLPKKLTSKLKIEKVRVYASALNLLTLTKYPGYDPEVNSYDSNSSRQGVDVGAYPTAKSYNVGLSITF